MLLLLSAVGALVGAAVLEFGFGRWGLVLTVMALQVAGHVLFDPLHTGRGGGHAHGVAGQVADANASAFLDHLTGSAALMVLLHSAAAALVAVIIGVASPLLALLVRIASVLRPRPSAVAADPFTIDLSQHFVILRGSLAHIVVRRGPPALV